MQKQKTRRLGNRTETLTLRLTPSEKALIKRLSKEKGVSHTKLITQGIQLLSFSLFDSFDLQGNGKDDQNG